MVGIGDGAYVPRTVSATGRYPGLTVKLVASYDEELGRYRTRTLDVSADYGGEVTGTLLRAVRVEALLREAAATAADHAVFTATPAGAGPTDDNLRAVAAIYRIAVILGEAPVQTVAERLSVPRSTAARWVTRARDRGLLSVVDKRARTEG